MGVFRRQGLPCGLAGPLERRRPPAAGEAACAPAPRRIVPARPVCRLERDQPVRAGLVEAVYSLQAYVLASQTAPSRKRCSRLQAANWSTAVAPGTMEALEALARPAAQRGHRQGAAPTCERREQQHCSCSDQLPSYHGSVGWAQRAAC